MRRNTWIALAGVVVFGAAFLLWQGSAGGQTPLRGEPGIGHLVAGLYYGEVVMPNTGEAIKGVWKIDGDGTCDSSNSVEMAATGTYWSNAYAAWARTGPRSIAATWLFLGYEPLFPAQAGGVHTMTMKVHTTMHFDHDFQTAAVHQWNEIFFADQDPLDPTEEPFMTIWPPFTYTVNRVNVEYLEPPEELE